MWLAFLEASRTTVTIYKREWNVCKECVRKTLLIKDFHSKSLQDSTHHLRSLPTRPPPSGIKFSQIFKMFFFFCFFFIKLYFCCVAYVARETVPVMRNLLIVVLALFVLEIIIVVTASVAPFIEEIVVLAREAAAAEPGIPVSLAIVHVVVVHWGRLRDCDWSRGGEDGHNERDDGKNGSGLHCSGFKIWSQSCSFSS